MQSKFSFLPLEIRNQLNHRLLQAEPASSLLPWLNSLPEVQAALAEHFDGQPISEVNLSDYRIGPFRRWQMRQNALQFATDEAADNSASTQVDASPLIDNLVRWSATRLAASQTAPMPEEVQSERQELRNFISDIVALRRGELVARRLAIEQQRLALEQAKKQEELEELFWKWTKRPDIQAKLYPHRDPDKARRDAVRLLDEHFLGVRRTNNGSQEPDPDAACFI